MNTKKITTILIVLLFVTGCATNQDQSSGYATFMVQMHDNTADFDKVNVQIEKVEVQQANGQWIKIGEPKTYNLLNLINGNMAFLGETQVDPGRYQKLRMEFGEENNIVVNEETHDLDIVGDIFITIDLNVELEENDEFMLNLDFDAARSVRQIDESTFELTPIIRGYGEEVAGIVSGRVEPSTERLQVNAVNQDSVFTTTFTNKVTGAFKLVGLEPGSYDIELVYDSGEEETTIYDVEVNADSTTKVYTVHRNQKDLFEDDQWTRETLHPGVELFRNQFDLLFDSKQYMSIVAVYLNQSDVRVRFSSTYLYDEVRWPISQFGETEEAIAASNGGYGTNTSYGFAADKYYNSGILKIDGQVLPFLREEEPERWFVGYGALGINSDKKWVFINRQDKQWPPDWPEVDHALAGAQRLLEDGDVYPDILDENKWRAPVEDNNHFNRHPRTAICIRDDNVGLMIAVDGRADQAAGMNLPELALYMKRHLGCVDGINLDGGGSTTLWTDQYGVVNHPSGNGKFDHEGQRVLKTAIIVEKVEEN